MKKQLFIKGVILALVGMTSVASVAQEATVMQTIYVDFGEPGSNTNRGTKTEGADQNGNYWTNVYSSGNNFMYPFTEFNVVNAQNETTGYTIVPATRFTTNGMSGGGGLTAPSTELLGDLAVATATQDYAFLEGDQDFCAFIFKGLNRERGYRFHLFGSRLNESYRSGTFILQGDNQWEGVQAMSGKNIGEAYNGNNNNVLTSDVVFPDQYGTITLFMKKRDIGGMIHLNAAKIEEISGAANPYADMELTQKMLIDFGSKADSGRGEPTTGADQNGHYWNNVFANDGTCIKYGTQLALVNTQDANTGVTLTVASTLDTNGNGAGGNLNPNADYLHELAVKSATEDYAFFNSDDSKQLHFAGLDPQKTYRFTVYGCRITSTVRRTDIVFEGKNYVRRQVTTSGQSTGGNGTDGNTLLLIESGYITPDEMGNARISFAKVKDMSHINAVKVEEYAVRNAVSLPTAAARSALNKQTIYVDFGEMENARGFLTLGADQNGNYWTNAYSSSDIYIRSGEQFNMVNNKNEATGYVLQFGSNFTTNGMDAGGLKNPSSDLLGDLAVATATSDYAFVEAWLDNSYIYFRNLNPQHGYRFHLFGTRSTTEERGATFTLRGSNQWSGYQQMSGSGIGTDGYNGNNDKVLVSEVIFPDQYGTIAMSMRKLNPSGLAHISAMKIEDLPDATNTSSAVLKQKMLLDFGSNNDAARGYKTAGADQNGNYWTNVAANNGWDITAGSSFDIVNTKNERTGYTLVVNNQITSNGRSNGGPCYPLANDLHEMAVQSATEDYVFIDNTSTTKTFTFKGLQPKQAYKFAVYGCRVTDQGSRRFSNYSFSGMNTETGQMLTSGYHEGGLNMHGNIRNYYETDYVFPDKNGVVTLTFNCREGMCHFNLIRIEEYEGVEYPYNAPDVRALVLSGTATETGEDIAFVELKPNNTSTGIFDLYTRLVPGQYMLKGTESDGGELKLGQGDDGTVAVDGQAFNVAEEQVVRMRYHSGLGQLTVTPITLFVKGNLVAANKTIPYVGNGVFEGEVVMDKPQSAIFSDKYMYFAFNNDDQLGVKRIQGSGNRNKVGTVNDGYSVENIRINEGTYTISIDMANLIWDINAPIDEHKISTFGSSVCNGQGADSNHGYAYLYGQLVERRHTRGLSEYPFHTSGISIGGNRTTDLLYRYDEMTHDFGRYVMIGLSMANEGLHGTSDKAGIYNQFSTNMKQLIAQMKSEGKVPVVINNYTHSDYDATDYSYIKKMDVDIHQWDVPSVNVLGAVDDGNGHWSDGFMADGGHPNATGHTEFMYAIPPSLFDALADGKPLPVREVNGSYTLPGNKSIVYKPESTLHSFTVTLRVKVAPQTTLVSFKRSGSDAILAVDDEGHVVYTTADGLSMTSTNTVADEDYHYITISHYYASKRTILYIDRVLSAQINERRVCTLMTIGGNQAADMDIAELFVYRAGMTLDEVKSLAQNKMMKSSLEIYSPMSNEAVEPAADSADNANVDGAVLGTIVNKAQSLNKLTLVNAIPTGIGGVEAIVSSNDSTYSLGGVKIPEGAAPRGLVIQNGKKTVK